MSNNLVLGVPPAVMDLVQSGAIEREFHDALVPNLAYRGEALREEWDANSGTEIVMTRAGLLAPIVKPLPVGSDPLPRVVPYEQWVMSIAQYADGVDTHMPTSAVAAANKFLRDLQQLGIGAAMSVNRVARNKLFESYQSGNTVITSAVLTTDTSLHVASLNGFTDVVIPNATTRPAPVSPSNPLPVTIGPSGSGVVKNVIAFIADDPSDPIGPGTLVFSSAIGTAFAGPRVPVVSKYAARVVRAAAGASIDSITPSDGLTLQQIINGVGFLRDARVPVHDDGFYHMHYSNSGNSQLYADPVFQRLNQSLPEGATYRSGYVGHLNGVMFYVNDESPNTTNVGTLIPTGSGGPGEKGQYGPEIGAEVVNGAGVGIGRAILTGKGCMYERYLDEAKNYVTEAGLNGKQGEFDIVNNGIAIKTDDIRLVIGAPVDRLRQVVPSTWSITNGFACPSDITAPSGPQRFKRALILEHAI